MLAIKWPLLEMDTAKPTIKPIYNYINVWVICIHQLYQETIRTLHPKFNGTDTRKGNEKCVDLTG